MQSKVAIDRLVEIAGELDDRACRPTLANADEARCQQPVARAIRNGVQQASHLTHSSRYDVRRLTVDHELDSELTQKRPARHARCRDDTNAAHVCELNEQAPDAATRTVYEHRLARLQRKPIEQLERGRARQGNRRRVDGSERLGPQAEPALFDLDVLRIGAEARAAHREYGPDGVTVREARYPGTEFLDPARKLVADDVRRLDPGPSGVRAIGRVDRVDAGRRDPDDDVTRSGARPRELGRLERLRWSRLTDDNRAHVAAEATAPATRRYGHPAPSGDPVAVESRLCDDRWAARKGGTVGAQATGRTPSAVFAADGCRRRFGSRVRGRSPRLEPPERERCAGGPGDVAPLAVRSRAHRRDPGRTGTRSEPVRLHRGDRERSGGGVHRHRDGRHAGDADGDPRADRNGAARPGRRSA